MSLKYTKVAPDSFEKIQMNAGVAVTKFNVSTGEVDDTDILGLTTGGFTFQANVNITDKAENIDNVKKNTKEFAEITDREVTASTTFVSVDTRLAKLLNAGADISGDKITPRDHLDDADFTDFWIVGDYSDENTGDSAGYIAIHMLNVLSTGGFQMKTTDKKHGEFAATFRAFYSMDALDQVPYEIYIHKGAAA